MQTREAWKIINCLIFEDSGGFLSFLQVQNLIAVHSDYGNRVQALLDKHNAEGKKVENISISLIHFNVHGKQFILYIL